MHPSYEDRPGAPDRVFAAVDDADYERTSTAWAGALQRGRRRRADVLHLHHLTPLHEAAARVAPDVPVVDPPARHRAADARGDRRRRPAGRTPRPGRARMRRWARRLRAAARALAGPGRARRAAARRRPGRAACVAPTASTPSASRRATSTAPRSGATHLVERPARLAARRRGGHRRLRPPRPSARWRDAPVLDLRRPLHRGQAPRAAGPRLRPRARPRCAAPRVARARRRLPGRVGGRAPARRDRARPARATSSSPAGTTTTSCPTFLARRRRGRAGLGARAVRLGAGRGDGLRPAGDRRRPLRPGRHRRAGRHRVARRARRRGRAGGRAGRRPSRPGRAPPPRRRARAATRTSASRGRRWPSAWPRSSTRWRPIATPTPGRSTIVEVVNFVAILDGVEAALGHRVASPASSGPTGAAGHRARR